MLFWFLHIFLNIDPFLMIFAPFECRRCQLSNGAKIIKNGCILKKLWINRVHKIFTPENLPRQVWIWSHPRTSWFLKNNEFFTFCKSWIAIFFPPWFLSLLSFKYFLWIRVGTILYVSICIMVWYIMYKYYA